jgi:predicted nucleic acid-binding protein
VIVLDSSAWIEIFVGGPKGDEFGKALHRIDQVLVPAICLTEVNRFLLRTVGEEKAQDCIASMRLAQVVDLTPDLAVEAARLGLKHGLPTADSIVFATAMEHDAKLWTQDVDFKGLEGVRYLAKGKA